MEIKGETPSEVSRLLEVIASDFEKNQLNGTAVILQTIARFHQHFKEYEKAEIAIKKAIHHKPENFTNSCA